MGAFETADDFVLGDACLHVVVQLLSLDLVLFVVPSELFEI